MDRIRRFVLYQAGGAERVGILADGHVVDFEAGCRQAGIDLQRPPAAVVDALTDSACLDAAAQLVQWLAERGIEAAGEAAKPREQVKLLAPVPRPPKLFLLAGNYAEHIMESAQRKKFAGMSSADMATPRVFMKPPSVTVCGDGDPIILGRSSRWPDYEAEMAVIVGRGGRFWDDPEAAEKNVAGVTILNDVSERELLIWERPEEREWDKFFDWLNGKWFDNAAPMGPCAVPAEDIGDFHNLRLRLWLNGELKQDASTGQMIFGVGQILCYISFICTLEPGDVIATGTPAGVGYAQGIKLKGGDVVEIELEKVGRLRNPVVQVE